MTSLIGFVILLGFALLVYHLASYPRPRWVWILAAVLAFSACYEVSAELSGRSRAFHHIAMLPGVF